MIPDLPVPRLDPTTFPDAEVTTAVDVLRRVASRLEDAAGDRAAATAPALASWQGRTATVVGEDHAAGQRAATALAEQLRAQAARLEDAADDAAELRRRRRRTYEESLATWRRLAASHA